MVAAGVIALALAAGARALLAEPGRTRGATKTATSDTRAARWPATFEGRPLERAALLPVEERFGENFPGAFAAFTDGKRRIVFRRIDAPTRMVHPAGGCLRGAGFAVRPLPAHRNKASGLWAALEAEKDGVRLFVRERISAIAVGDSPASEGASKVWTDVSAWYWSALMRPSSGPWMAITVIERGE